MNGYALIFVLGGVLLAIERLRPGTPQCGYHPGREQRLAQMLVFQDVNK